MRSTLGQRTRSIGASFRPARADFDFHFFVMSTMISPPAHSTSFIIADTFLLALGCFITMFFFFFAYHSRSCKIGLKMHVYMVFDFFLFLILILEPCPHFVSAPFPPLYCAMSSCHYKFPFTLRAQNFGKKQQVIA